MPTCRVWTSEGISHILTPGTRWMDLEDTVLSGMIQTQKDRPRLIPLPGGP